MNKYLKISFLPLILIHIIVLENIRFTLWPEMVVYPYLLNNNYILYRDIITNYSPIFIYFLSFWSHIFGYQPLIFQLLTLLIVIIIDICLFSIAKRLFGTLSANISLIFFIIISIPFGINGLWFDLAITPFILCSFFLFIKFINKPQQKYLFYCFLLLTIAFFIKQQTIWVYLWFLIVALFYFRKQMKFVLPKIVISTIPLILFSIFFLLFFAEKQILSEYIYWNFGFPFTIAIPGAGYNQIPTVRQFIIVISLFLIFTPSFFIKKIEIRLTLFVSLLLTAFAYRFDYFHLIPSLTILSLIAGENIMYILNRKKKYIIVSIFSFIVILYISLRFLIINWQQQIRFFESGIISTAKLITLITSENDPIYIQNGPDQLYPLAGRLPVKPWSDEFPWYLEDTTMQKRVIDGLINKPPQYIVFQTYEAGSDFNLGSYKPKLIVNYLDKNYSNYFQISNNLWLKKKI